MTQLWFFEHSGETHGPVSSEEIKNLAREGKLAGHDLLWQEGAAPEHAVTADAALDFANLHRSLPGWLDDVALLDEKGPVPAPRPSSELPEWLQEMLLWFSLDLPAPRPQSLSPESAEELPVCAGHEAGRAISGQVEAWRLEALVEKSPEAASPPQPSTLTPAVPPSSLEPASPPDVPERREPAPEQASVVAKHMLLATGFNVTTGEIVDPVKFQNWKRQISRPVADTEPALTNASLFEIFHKARVAVDNWVDDDNNGLLVMQATINDIQKDSRIREILAKYADSSSSSELALKLQRHLVFMVENRRKYYQAMEQAS